MSFLILILGRRGTGKTTLARRLIQHYPKNRILVHDPMGEFGEYELLADNCPAESIPAGTVIVADELDLIAPPHSWGTRWIRDVFHYGRHLDLSLVGCSRRPANVHRDVTALVSQVYLGRITEPRDIDYCVSAWGQACARAPTLPPYEFLAITP